MIEVDHDVFFIEGLGRVLLAGGRWSSMVRAAMAMPGNPSPGVGCLLSLRLLSLMAPVLAGHWGLCGCEPPWMLDMLGTAPRGGHSADC